MAWIDDRIWCHPKFTGLTDAQFAAYVKGVAYSSGMGTRGVLTCDQQRLMFVQPRTRVALINAGLWDVSGSAGDVRIHDWDEHNGKRDERRRRDRIRKQEARRKEAERPQDSPQDIQGTSNGVSAGPAHVDSSEGSEGSDTAVKDAADEMSDLANAGWSGKQIREAGGDMVRALAWLAHAEADPTVQSVGAFSWSMFKQGGWPEEKVPTIAAGAQGTRSTSKAVTYTCEECAAVFDTYLAREEHVDQTHFEPVAPPTQRLSA